MIIEIEGYQTEAQMTGPICTEKVLRQKFKNVLTCYDFIENNFVSLFCRLNEFTCIPYMADREVDYVLDLDTQKIYKLRY